MKPCTIPQKRNDCRFRKLTAGMLIIMLVASFFLVGVQATVRDGVVNGELNGVRWGQKLSGDIAYTIIREGDENALDERLIGPGIGDYVTIAFSPDVKADGKVSIPDEIDGVKVLEIGDYAFVGCDKMVEVIIPEGVVRIGKGAFEDCSALRTVTLPDSLRDCTAEAFLGTPWLEQFKEEYLVVGDGLMIGYKGTSKNMNIPEGVRRVVADVAQPGINAVLIPASVIYINIYRTDDFLWSSTLQRIDVDIENKVYAGMDGVLYNKEMTALLRCPISKKGRLTVPEGVRTIEDRAMEACKALTEVVLPSSLLSIGEGAFSGGMLTHIYVHADNSVYTDVDGVLFNKERSSLELCPKGRTGAYSVPDGVRRIADGAFENCRVLGEIVLPSSLEYIGDRAFTGYGMIMSERIPIKIPDGVTVIGERAFADCATFDAGFLPASVREIKDEAFAGSAPKMVSIGPGVRHIGVRAFSGKVLTRIDVDEDNTMYSSDNGVLYSKDKTVLLACPDKTITAYIIPEGVRRIGDCAFIDNSALSDVSLPSSLEDIGNYAFAECIRLKNADLRPSVQHIGEGAFTGCTNLDEVIFGETLKTVGDFAFSACQGLTEITIPSSAESIGKGAFSLCRLTTATFLGMNTQIGPTVQAYEPFGPPPRDVVFAHSDDLTIVAPAGSRAEEYANNSGIAFSALTNDEASKPFADNRDIYILGAGAAAAAVLVVALIVVRRRKKRLKESEDVRLLQNSSNNRQKMI